MHHIKLAKCDVCTFKEHLKYLRATCDTKFPKHIWCQLIPQANITLNILQQARLHPKLSSYHVMWGAFNYNKTTLSPPGTHILVHENPKQRATWDNNGV